MTAQTRSPGKQQMLRSLGAMVAVVDALNRDALVAALADARPTHVIHQLTALPAAGPRRASDITETSRLRTEGTRNLLEAAIAAGAKRIVVGSFALLSHAPAGDENPDASAVHSMERQVLEASARGSIESVVLRYGMFYGPHVPSTVAMVDLVRRRMLPIIRGDSGQLPVIHIDDAVSATVAALQKALAGSALDIVDDRAVSMTDIVETIVDLTHAPRPLRVPALVPRIVAPYVARMTATRMPLSNAEAKAVLGWQPAYTTMREGLRQSLQEAA